MDRCFWAAAGDVVICRDKVSSLSPAPPPFFPPSLQSVSRTATSPSSVRLLLSPHFQNRLRRSFEASFVLPFPTPMSFRRLANCRPLVALARPPARPTAQLPHGSNLTFNLGPAAVAAVAAPVSAELSRSNCKSSRRRPSRVMARQAGLESCTRALVCTHNV